MATFRQRGSTWRAEVFICGQRDSGTFDTKNQAKAWAARRETEIRENAGIKPVDYSFAEALERYKSDVSPKKKGYKWETDRINMLIREHPKLVKKPIAQITTDDLGRFRDQRLKKVTSATVRRDFSLLSAVFNTARLEWKWIASSPVTDLKLPSPPAHRDRRISDDEIERLCLAMGFVEGEQPKTYTQQIAVAFLLAIETAMRAGEIRALTWDKVNLDRRFVRLDVTKNGTKREVSLSRRAVELLRQMQGIDDHQVFTVAGASFDALFRKARNRCQIDNLHFHDTRHEACTRLARKLQMLDLARMIGHKDPRSLMIYYNATASEIAEFLD